MTYAVNMLWFCVEVVMFHAYIFTIKVHLLVHAYIMHMNDAL